MLLEHITLHNKSPFNKNVAELDYPVYGILCHYGASIVGDIFVRVSDLDKEDQDVKTNTLFLCYMLLNNIYRVEVDGKAILRKRIQHEINARPQDGCESLKALLRLSEK